MYVVVVVLVRRVVIAIQTSSLGMIHFMLPIIFFSRMLVQTVRQTQMEIHVLLQQKMLM